MFYISNQFHPGMLASGACATIREIELETARSMVAKFIPSVCCVDHIDTGIAMSVLLKTHVGCDRITINLRSKDMLLFAQPPEPFLLKEAIELPKEAGFRWFLMIVG